MQIQSRQYSLEGRRQFFIQHCWINGEFKLLSPEFIRGFLFGKNTLEVDIIEIYMQRALELARRGKGAVAPNPLVGAVMVKDGKILAEGWHGKYGGAHAEVEAINKAGECDGATLYVNLEPCSHYGKTPPCTEKIITAGIKKVVCAMVDPNPKVAGRGIARLRAKGIEVEVGLMEKEARQLNEVFCKYIEEGQPFVALKLALSLDGKIAAADGSASWITGEKAREKVHKLRENYQAIMAGSGTILADDPRLNCRLDNCTYQPIKIILDRRGRVPGERKIWEQGETWLVSQGEGFRPEKPHRLVEVDQNAGPEEILNHLGELGISGILLEGGARLAAEFISRGLVDKYFLFFAPKLLGGRGKGFTENLALDTINDALVLNLSGVQVFGEDLLGVYYPEEG